MKHILVIAILLGFTVYPANSQDKSAMTDSLETIDLQIRRTAAKIESYKAAYEHYEAIIDEYKRELQKAQNEALPKDVSELQQLRDKNISEVVSLQDDIKNLKQNHSALITSLDYVLKRYHKLADMEKEASADIIKRNEAIFSLPFSQLQEEQILSAQNECKGLAYDSNSLDKFLRRVDILLQNKRTYEKAKTAVSSKYSENRIEQTLKEIGAMNELNDKQTMEIQELKRQLETYPKGMSVLKDFITRINQNREGVSSYSINDLNDDLTVIYKRIGNDLEQYVNSVPYLRKEYEKFLKELKENPQSHTDFENEIMSFAK